MFAQGLTINTGNGFDGLVIGYCEVLGDTLLLMGAENDSLTVGSGFPGTGVNRFDGKFTADGGRGIDSHFSDPANDFAVKPLFQSFENR